MPNPVSLRQTQPQTESRDPALLVDVLVLSADLLLFDAIRASIGERNPVWRARSAEESVDLLLTGRCGVLLVDTAAVSTAPTTLIAQIVEQFPDVVVIVAGRREDEAILAQSISDGLVYRFMHKPLSAKRAGMFLHAAIRRHVEKRESHSITAIRPTAAILPGRFDPGKWLFVAIGLAMFIALLWLLGSGRSSHVEEAPAQNLPSSAAPAAPPSQPLADPVLSRARAAFAAGRYESPAGRNALDLYAAVLLARPGQAEARGGLDRTIDQVVRIARLAEADGNHAEARRLLARVESVDASNLAVARLAAYLAAPAARDSAAAAPGTAATSPSALATSRPQAAPTAARPADTHAPATATVTPPATTSPHVAIASAPQTATRARTGATTPPATATDRPTQATVPPVVRPDPLAPRVVNADQMHEKELLASRRYRPRTYGPPVSNGLPTAGYVKTRPPEPPAYKSASGLDPAVAAALAMPADELNRVYATDPVYPTAAFRDHVEGWVELSFTITETGAVRDIEVVDSEPRGVFESAASEALGAWRFKPRLANGQPVSHRSTVTLRFDVDG